MNPRYAPQNGVSALVISYNEEVNIERALRSLQLVSDDIWLIDSESTDRTVEIAESLGVNVVVRPWPGYVNQWNYALSELPLQHPYVLLLDADEEIPEAWAAELRDVLEQPSPPDMIQTRFRFWWMGKPVEHGQYGKAWVTRVGRRELMRYEEREVNEHIPLQGEVYQMKTPYEHYDAKNVAFWLKKHIRYALLETIEREKAREEINSYQPRLFGGGQSDRVLWLRQNVYDRLPPLMRPMAYFLYRYVLGMGWRDGLTGTFFHILHGFWFPLLMDIFEKERELQRKGRL
jgi:glycosyltransferase involved in cell wall biosynthesis